MGSVMLFKMATILKFIKTGKNAHIFIQKNGLALHYLRPDITLLYQPILTK